MLTIRSITVDCTDPYRQALFWSEVTGWPEDPDDPNRPGDPEGRIVDPHGVSLLFIPVPEGKTVKNRVHLDLTTSAADRDAEIERLLALGARRVDIGQTGEESWTVLADPEGNEFFVIRPKTTLID